jgi:rhomboid protease GluP
MLIWIGIVVALLWYFMTAAERERIVRRAVAFLPSLKVAAAMLKGRRDELLEQALRERTRWPVVTALVVGANLALYTWAQMDGGVSLADLLANFAPRTTNGEWWRLLTSTFVHESAIVLLLNMAALAQLGRVLERLVGSWAFAATFAVSGVFANLYGLSVSEASQLTGASSAVFGLYGLLIASWMWGAAQHADLAIRLPTIKALAPLGFVFSVVHLVLPGGNPPVECTGLGIGFLCGVFMTRWVRVNVPSLRRVATVAAAGAYVAVVSAVPLSGISDVRPVLARALAVEEHTSELYDAALKDFQNGRMDRRELALVIDKKILGELQVVRFELQALNRPPREHRPLVEAAEIYSLRRIQSWKLRAHALRTGDWRELRNADAVERAALDRLEAMRVPGRSIGA